MLRYGLGTDGSSNEDDKLLPVLRIHVDEDSGMIATSLLDMRNINSNCMMCEME